VATSPPRGLRIWQKLAAIYLAFTIPLALTTYLLIGEKSVKIELAHKEFHGGRYLRVVSRILQGVSSHRAPWNSLWASSILTLFSPIRR